MLSGNRWQVTFEYDDNSNKIYEELHGSGFYTKFTYDHANRLISQKERHKDGTTIEQTYEYDLMGNKTASTDSYGNRTQYDYDDCNRVTRITFPKVETISGSTEKYTIEREYDIFDNVISETNQNGRTTTFQYTARNKPCLVTYADGSQERFEYNLDGTLAHAWDRSGTKTSYKYDVLGRVLTTKAHDAQGQKLSETSNSYKAFYIETSTD